MLRQAIYFTEEIIQLDLNFNIFWPFISWGGSRFVQLGEVYGVGSQLFFSLAPFSGLPSSVKYSSGQIAS